MSAKDILRASAETGQPISSSLFKSFFDESIESAQEYTYAELQQMVTDSSLVVGQPYIITDYFDTFGGVATDNESILLIAKTANSFFSKVKSMVYDAEYIYEFSNTARGVHGSVMHCWVFSEIVDGGECFSSMPFHFKAKDGSGLIALISYYSKVSGTVINGGTGSIVSGGSIVSYSEISDYSTISGNSTVYKSKVAGNSTVSGGSSVNNNSSIIGNSYITGSTVSNSYISGGGIDSGSNINNSIIYNSIVSGINMYNCEVINVNLYGIVNAELIGILQNTSKKFIYNVDEVPCIEYTEMSSGAPNKRLKKLSDFV